MKEKVANTALGELLLLIARDERIYRAMARLNETEVPFVLTGAISSLQQFLDEYGTPEAEPGLRAGPVVTRRTPVATTIFTGARASDSTRESIPIPPKRDVAAPVATPAKPPEPKTPPSVPVASPAPSTKLQEHEREVKSTSPSSSPQPRETVSVPSVSPRAEAVSAPPIPTSQPSPAGTVSPAADRAEKPRPAVEKPEPEVAPPPKAAGLKLFPQKRVPFEFEDQQCYVHGVSLIPLSDSPSPAPFLVEEQGLDPRARMFALDHAGMRFFLSELNPDGFNVSKNGMLLLSKQDSLRLRGAHERIVNRLRQYGSILPAEFGTAVLGRSDLSRRVEFRLHALLEFVLDLGRTTTWRVSAFVLDERVQRLLGPEQRSTSSARHESDRGRHAAPAKRIDVKSLERLLTQEKKIAEAVLDALAPLAESHTVEQIVNLGSGRSEDWKAILTTLFVLGAGQNPRFFRAVLDAESDHGMAELMLRLTGTTECFSLLM